MGPQTPLPNLFLIGAAKAGTTTLAAQLGLHPSIFVCHPKEPSYFTHAIDLPGEPTKAAFTGYDFATTWPDYLARFAQGADARWRLDASTGYLIRPDAAHRIATHVPDAQILAILRDPAERSYSHWAFWTMYGFEHLSFDEAISAEVEGRPMRNGVDRRYLAASRYGQSVSRYLREFPADRVRMFDYRELCRDANRLYSEIFEHLELEPLHLDGSRSLNVTALPRLRMLDPVFRRAKRRLRTMEPSSMLARRARKAARLGLEAAERLNRRPVPPMSAGARQRVIATLSDDIRLLDTLVPWDALGWLADPEDAGAKPSAPT